MKYNKTAFIIMLVAILGSSIFSGVGGMKSLVKPINDYFISGGNAHDNSSIYNDLLDKAAVCESLINLANKYVSSSDTHIKEMQKAIATIKETKDVSDLYAANVKLDNNAAWLIAELKNKNMDSTHKSLLIKYVDDYNDDVRMIGFDASNYNLMVKKYYDETSGIPGSLFRIFVNDPEYFR